MHALSLRGMKTHLTNVRPFHQSVYKSGTVQNHGRLLCAICYSSRAHYSGFQKLHRCTVHFVKSLQLLTNKCTYITFT